MAMLYLLSGITIVRADEVVVVLRWGRLVGDTPALQEHGAGLLFALPRPIDQVVRVQTKRVREVSIWTLSPDASTAASASGEEDEDAQQPPGETLDPLTQGYALTGDHNIVQLSMVARYRIRDAGEWSFYGPTAEDVLRAEVTAAMVQSLGEMGVDRVLSDGRKELIAIAARRAQAGLDASHSGLELSSVELTRLAPPQALAYDFSAVQSAFISAETKKKEAQEFAERAIPAASAQADGAIQNARAAVATDLATATGEAEAFKALEREYRANTAVVRERLYRDAVDRAISAGNVRWIPPPVGGAYHGLRITVSATGARTPASVSGGDRP
ncbi:MAG TPA: protease modulator HflK [Gemmatimonadaceae bacterium]|nr:protease modulator HflK [Gemmatimonadaceae bacterium]